MGKHSGITINVDVIFMGKPSGITINVDVKILL